MTGHVQFVVVYPTADAAPDNTDVWIAALDREEAVSAVLEHYPAGSQANIFATYPSSFGLRAGQVRQFKLDGSERG